MGFDSSDEMKFSTLGIAARGPIVLGSDFGNESRISIDITKKALSAATLQELERSTTASKQRMLS